MNRGSIAARGKVLCLLSRASTPILGPTRPSCNGYRGSFPTVQRPTTHLHPQRTHTSIPPTPNTSKWHAKNKLCILGTSARRAHKVAIRPVIQLPDVAHPDESLTVMLQRWAVANSTQRQFKPAGICTGPVCKYRPGLTFVLQKLSGDASLRPRTTTTQRLKPSGH